MTDHAMNPTRAKPFELRSLIYDPKLRSIFYQFAAIIILFLTVWAIVNNVAANLAQSRTASGFDFLERRSGFDIGTSLVEYSSDSTYGRALYVGFLNTAMVAVLGIITATIIGFIVGIGRLSKNWLIARLSTVYVEFFRNIPPLLVIFFWYAGVLSSLPQVRDALSFPGEIFLSNRGLTMPKPIFGEGSWLILAALVVGIAASLVYSRWAKVRQMATGQRPPVFFVSALLIIGLPLVAFLGLGSPLTFDIPQKGRFNLSGGMVLGPEFVALYLALSFYTASFIAEIIRSGIKGVAKGQSEAAHALGLSPGMTTRLIVVPQAMRIIIPPLTSQYLNLTKNSTLGAAIGFSELFFTSSVTRNQTGQAVEVVAILLVIYLAISVVTSLFMNWFNAKMALVER